MTSNFLTINYIFHGYPVGLDTFKYFIHIIAIIAHWGSAAARSCPALCSIFSAPHTEEDVQG